MSFIGGIGSRIRAFGALAAWLVGLLLRGARARTLAAFALSLAGTATHVAAVATFLAFVHAQTSDGVLSYGPLTLEARTTLPSLSLWSAAVLLLALSTAAAAYASARLTFDAGRQASRAFLRRALAVMTDSHRAHHELLSDERGLALARKAFVGDSFILIRTAVAGVGLFAPLLLFLVASGVLLSLDPWLTAGIAVPLAIFAVPFWRLNRSLVRAARRYKELIPVRSGRLKELFDDLSRTHAGEPAPAEVLDEVLADPATVGAEEAVGRIMLRGHKVNFLRLVFVGLVLCGLLFATGAFLSADERSWTALATYAISLQYAVATIASVATSLTSVTRFVPFLERMRALTSGRPAAPAGGGATALVARAVEPRLPGSEAERRLRPGEVLLCANPRPLNAFGLTAFLERLGARGDEAATLAAGAFYCGDPDAGTVLAALGVEDGLLADRSLFVLDWRALSAGGPEETARALSQLAGRMTILVTNQLPRKPPVDVTVFALMGKDRLLGLGDADWWRKLDQGHRLVREFHRVRQTARDLAEATEEDEEEELLD